jgi:aryl-alcohol dehydrogenase-like predicted oxidoreductase
MRGGGFMKTRPYGNTGKFISEIGFGAWQLGNEIDWGRMNDIEAVRLVREALDSGINFFDTAPNYGLGKSEELLGKALQGKRDQVVINTKFGHHSDGGLDFSAAKIRQSLENSLRRLQTDYVDSIMIHNPPFEFLNGKASHYEIFEQLQSEGKILAYGASVDSSREMSEVLQTTNSGVIEVMFNIFHQEPATAFQTAQAKNVGLVIKVPLDSGWLAGKYNAGSKFDDIRERWPVEVIRRRAEMLDKISFIRDEKTTMVQAALRFILSYPEVSTVIPGARNLDQLWENISAGEAAMPGEHIKRLREIWERDLRDNPLGW